LPELRILVADDHELVRRGLRTLLETQPGWRVVAEAQDGQEAVGQTLSLKPDVVVMDIGMPRLNGLEAVRRLAKTVPDTKILILTMHDSDEVIRASLEAGARGFISKSGATRELVLAVDALRKGKTYFASQVEQIMLDSLLHRSKTSGENSPFQIHLTSRQHEILQLLVEGKTSKEVASELALSAKTVETHRTNIMRKLNCHSVSELVRYAIRNNVIQP
jgi:DNA-binding NarL/FixJ family response regulator